MSFIHTLCPCWNTRWDLNKHGLFILMPFSADVTQVSNENHLISYIPLLCNIKIWRPRCLRSFWHFNTTAHWKCWHWLHDIIPLKSVSLYFKDSDNSSRSLTAGMCLCTCPAFVDAAFESGHLLSYLQTGRSETSKTNLIPAWPSLF